MFKHQGIWLPDGEAHFPEWMTRNGEVVEGKGTYQIKKLRAALGYVKRWRRAVDVGAHVGLWAMHLAPKFERLECFEPMPPFRNCFVQNVQASNVTLHRYALGAADRDVRMVYDPKDSGGTHVGETGGDVKMRTLDSFLFTDIDFIKVDCEGYELPVLQGARATLEACRPTIIVEQKQHKLGANYGLSGVPAVDYLRDMGWKMVKELGGDFIMVFP